MTLDHPWYFLLFCLLLGAVYAGAMYFVGGNGFSSWLRWLLALLRALAVSTIAFLLLSPIARRTVHERQPPLIVFAEDQSLSVSEWLPDGDGFPLHGLQERLGDDLRIVYTSNQDNVNQTDLGALLDVPRDAAAVVLSSDGIYNRGQNPVSVAERLGIPVYTVALGDTTPRRDAALSQLRANRIAYLKRPLTFEVTVSASQLGGRESLLWVTEDAGQRRLAVENVRYEDDHHSSTHSIAIEASRPGLHRYDVWLKVVDGEENEANNHLSFYVDVIGDEQKVAIVGAAPHPDLAALKQAVESTTGYEATVLMASDLQKSALRTPNSELTLAILHNLPTASLPVPEAVRELPQMYVIGMQTDLPRFNAMKKGLEIVSRVKKSSEYTAVYNAGFTLFHYERGDGEALEQLPPLMAPFGEAKPSEGLQSLLTGRLGNIDTRQPLVAATSQGGRRTAFVWGEGLWRWRLVDYLNNQSHEHFDRLVSQLVNFLAQEEGRERFRVETERIYPAGQNVTLGAQLYNEAYEPINIPEAALTLQGDGTDGEYAFSRQGEGYALSLGGLPEGTYRYRATTQLDGHTLVAEGSFAVEEQHLEASNLTADHTLLRTVSTLTGGRTYSLGELDELEAALRELKPIIHTHTRHSELLGLPIVLALILLLLAAEWVLRKYHGEI